jgi:hypothetical protein
MLQSRSVLLTALLLSSPRFVHADNVAGNVLEYDPGVGFSAGYTNAASALGEPSRITSGPFGGPVDPFNPAFRSDQLVSLGAGGSLTLQLSSPIQNDPSHPFGLDFSIFGNAGFSITNGNFTGGGVTDGSLFGQNSGMTRVSVSLDNVHYYTLNPSLAPTVDGLFPTDGSGDFARPVNPSLTGPSFSGLDLAGIRALYAGSGGGAGFDISWAQDSNGNPVNLSEINFVRIDVLSGKSEIDGVVAVPEASILQLAFTSLGTAIAWRHWRRRHPVAPRRER